MDAVQMEPPLPAAQLEPFELPSDEQWAQLRVAEQARAAAQREELKELPIHRRFTLASRMHATVDPESLAEAGPSSLKALLRHTAAEEGPKGAEAAAAPDYVRRKGDTIRDMLSKKRQIFLVQMSLDNKRAEIVKLEHRARQREEALRAAESALQADTKRFDDFLTENDRKLQEALRRAEAEAKARQDKAAEAKRLAGAIAHTRAEIAKADEALTEARRCRAFLDRVTPEEHFAVQRAQRAAAKGVLRAAWRAACDAAAGRRTEAAAAKARAEHEMQWARTQQQFERAERACREATAALREAQAAPEPPEPDYSVVDQAEEGMYFEDPAQLLAVFSQLEGRNMFMIQAAQDAEQAVEAARGECERAEATLGADAAALRRQVEELEGAIRTAQQRCEVLRKQAELNLGGGGSSGGASSSGAAPTAAAAAGSVGTSPRDAAAALPQLLAKVAVAYEMVGFSRDASVTPLAMLAQVESRLEESLEAVETGVPAAAAEQIEKVREKERRQAAREQKLAAQQAEHEARIQRVLERAAAPAFKRATKMEMVRSTLQVRRKSSGRAQAADVAERELQAFLALEASG